MHEIVSAGAVRPYTQQSPEVRARFDRLKRAT